jgi:hypothetical protein
MKSFAKLPLYLGLGVFVLSIIVSASTIGQRRNLADQNIQATSAKANLTMTFSAPNVVGITLKSDKEISGVDMVVKYDKEKITILPSTLTAGGSFITSGGTLSEEPPVSWPHLTSNSGGITSKLRPSSNLKKEMAKRQQSKRQQVTTSWVTLKE